MALAVVDRSASHVPAGKQAACSPERRCRRPGVHHTAGPGPGARTMTSVVPFRGPVSADRLPATPTPLHRAVLALAVLAAPALSPAQTTARDAVVVTGSRFEQGAGELAPWATVITADELRRSGATSVNDALVRLAGVVGRPDLFGGGEIGLDLRGYGATAGANQVVVLDGLRLSEADLGSTPLAGIPIDSIERIELLRGSGAVLYGEGATGGVIAITTRAGARGRGVDGATHGQGQARAGSRGLRELGGGVSFGSGGFSLDANAARAQADGHRDNGSWKRHSSEVALQQQLGAWRLAARLGEDQLDSRLPGALTAAQAAENPSQTTHPDDHGALHNQRRLVQAEWQAGNWTLQADAGWRDKTLRSVYVSSFGASAYDYDIAARQLTARARHSSGLAGGRRNTLVFGHDDQRWERQVFGSFGSMARQRNRAWYVHDELTLAGGLALGAGLRREQVDKVLDSGGTSQTLDGRPTAWELSLQQPLGRGWAAWGRLARSFRLANADEFSFANNQLLRPQTARDLEAGARWQQRGNQLALRVWRSALTDEIGYDPSAGSFGANVNFDPTRRRGLEVDGRIALAADLSVFGSAAWRSARFQSGAHAGKSVPGVASRNLSAGAQAQLSAGEVLVAQLRHIGPAHPDLDNSCRIASTSVADLRWVWTPSRPLTAQGGRLELALGITNLFDRRYATQAVACSGGQPTSLYPEAGRGFNGSVRVSF